MLIKQGRAPHIVKSENTHVRRPRQQPFFPTSKGQKVSPCPRFVPFSANQDFRSEGPNINASLHHAPPERAPTAPTTTTAAASLGRPEK